MTGGTDKPPVYPIPTAIYHIPYELHELERKEQEKSMDFFPKWYVC